MGLVLGLRWVRDGIVSSGSFCTVQGDDHFVCCVLEFLNFYLGIMLNLGEAAISITTLVRV